MRFYKPHFRAQNDGTLLSMSVIALIFQIIPDGIRKLMVNPESPEKWQQSQQVHVCRFKTFIALFIYQFT